MKNQIGVKRAYYVIFAILFLFLSGCAGGRIHKGSATKDMPKVKEFRHPLPGAEIISYYGRRGKGFHDGVDLRKSRKGGEKVRAARAGVVISAKRMRGYGKMVLIKHKDGSKTRYAHLKKIYVKKGKKVKRGKKIGRVGNTGRSSTPHLHYEIITKHNRTVDPMFYLR